MAQIDISRLHESLRKAEFMIIEFNPEEDDVEFVHFCIAVRRPEDQKFSFMSDHETGKFVWTDEDELLEDFDAIEKWKKEKLNG